MRHIIRNEGPMSLLSSKVMELESNFYPKFCWTCKFRASPFSYMPRQLTEKNVPLSEKLRRKIWGTDEPPGQINPYSQDKSYVDTTQSAADETKRQKLAVEKSFDDYEPATFWDGLEAVGEINDTRKEEWLPGNIFQASFIPKEIMTNSDDITATLYQALVDILILHQAGYQVSEAFPTQRSSELTKKVQIMYSSSTGVTLHFPDGTSREEIFNSLISPTQVEEEEFRPKISGEEDMIVNHLSPTKLVTASHFKELKQNGTVRSSSSVGPPETEEKPNMNAIRTFESAPVLPNYQELFASWSPSWKKIPLTDPAIKFAVIKRMLQLSGIRLSDATITKIKCTGDLLASIVKPPKPKKLAEALRQNLELTSLPNVAIYDHRITLRDKETSVGRWKLIEAQFRARGLSRKESKI